MSVLIRWSSVFALVVMTGACGTPKAPQVESDLASLFSEQAKAPVIVEVTDLRSGEGDGDNVYLIATFDLKADGDSRFASGILAGTSLTAQEQLRDGRAEMLYQKQSGEWKFSGHIKLQQAPSK
jgi:hypothetical protein